MAKKRSKSQPHNKKIIPPKVIVEAQEQMEEKFVHIEQCTAADNKRGRKYVRLDCKKIYRLCLLGMSNEELADHFDISYSQWMDWITPGHKHFKSQLLLTLDSGREGAVSMVADRLFQRAMGYKHKAKKFFYNAEEDKVVEQEYIEHYPPSEAAAQFILKNKRPKDWKDKQIIEGPDGKQVMGAPVVNVLTDDTKIKKLLKDKEEAIKNQKKK